MNNRPEVQAEPVAYVKRIGNAAIIASASFYFDWEDLPDGTALYTHPPADIAAKLAEALQSIAYETRNIGSAHVLARAALAEYDKLKGGA